MCGMNLAYLEHAAGCMKLECQHWCPSYLLTYLLTLLTSRGGVIHDDVHYCDVNMMGHLTLITVRCLLQKSSIPHSVLIIVSCGWRRRVHGMLCHFYTCTLHFN